MEKSILRVPGMMCQHCVKSITGAVSALQGATLVEVDLEEKKVSVEYDAAQITLDAIKAAIEDKGFDVEF